MRNFTKGLSLFVLIFSLLAFNACTKDDDLIGDGGNESTCFDGIQNGTETGIDCGGDCAASCTTTPSCTDGIQNGNETGIDCGGDCDPCTTTPTCTDGIQNGNETGIDCGGDCDPCTTDPTCTDGIQNGDETGVDCGGNECPPCQADATCTDGIQNGNETGVDCGGSECPPCQADATCTDGIQNGNETGVDCGGSDCPPCANLVSMKEYITQDAKFSMLNAAVERAGFDVESVGPNTFFAPNNAAWQALLDNNGWSSIDQISPNVLNTILQYHFSTTGAYTSDQFTNSFQITIMYLSKTVHIDLNDPSNPKVVAGLITANLIGLDLMTSNGVIHEIDKVLLF